MQNKELFKKSKKDLLPVYIKKYFDIDISWEKMLDYLYFESNKEENKGLSYRNNPAQGSMLIGNAVIQHPLWIQFDAALTKIWDFFPEFNNFLNKLNLDFNCSEDVTKCNFYTSDYTIRNNCDCRAIWHPDSIKISLGPRVIDHHHDRWDACYLQLIGNSFWQINAQGKTYDFVLNSGDLLHFKKENTHKVWGNGPRAGLLIFDKTKQLIPDKTKK